MTNLELETELQTLVNTERKTTKQILVLIRKAEERRLPLLQGFKNTHKWLIQKYRYSGSAANRRVQAARLLKAVPSAEEKLEKGEVNLTTLTKTQSAIYREEKRSGERMSAERKGEILREVEGKTEDAAEKALFTLFPEEAKRESLRPVNGAEARLSVCLDEETLAELKHSRDLLSHALPGAGWAQVIGYVLKYFNKRETRVAKKSCEYIDAASGRRCGSTYQLEIDHIMPRVHGGTDDPSNLRCLCKLHNLFEAERKLGKEFMQRYRRSG